MGRKRFDRPGDLVLTATLFLFSLLMKGSACSESSVVIA